MSEKLINNNLNKEIIEENSSSNFIKQIIEDELKPGGRVYGKKIHTRFPPEPNGYLHIGHLKAIAIDFGMAEEFNGICHLRMDDTNPIKEDTHFIEQIKNDIKWLGYDWQDYFFYASDYFEQMYQCAITLIKKGLAYVCDLNSDELREYRGTLTEPGKESPYRNRTIEENLILFEKMRNGEFKDGSKTLRAKIDMSSGNINMRDPVIYRIAKQHHHRTGDDWCIYPMYDFAHPLEDSFEGITHSLCSLEFEAHRPLYDWVIQNTDVENIPRQIEFARLNLTNTVMSKRKLRQLVEDNLVDGWDDPRLPTIQGLRRRGYTPQSLRKFTNEIGVAKTDSIVDYQFLEHCLRDDLNDSAHRVMAVIDPLRLVITNYPDNKTEEVEIENHPKYPELGKHTAIFEKELFIEKDDFMENPAKKYFRLFVGNEVRLKGAYVVKCTGYDKDDNGNITTVYAEYDENSKGGNPEDGRKIKGTIHWASKNHSVISEVRLYDSLFLEKDPDKSEKSYLELLNENSLQIRNQCYIEPYVSSITDKNIRFQFMRLGYFCEDIKHSSKEHRVYNRAVGLRDTFNK